MKTKENLNSTKTMSKTYYKLSDEMIYGYEKIRNNDQDESTLIVHLAEEIAYDLSLEDDSIEFQQVVHFHMALYSLWRLEPAIKKIKIKKIIKAAAAITKMTSNKDLIEKLKYQKSLTAI